MSIPSESWTEYIKMLVKREKMPTELVGKLLHIDEEEVKRIVKDIIEGENIDGC